jgi:hypothetical protein
MPRQKQLSTLTAAFPKNESGRKVVERKEKGAQPHLQFGVGCIDQPIAQDRMPVLNVGPTVKQGTAHVSSWHEDPRGHLQDCHYHPFLPTEDMKMGADAPDDGHACGHIHKHARDVCVCIFISSPSFFLLFN